MNKKLHWNPLCKYCRLMKKAVDGAGAVAAIGASLWIHNALPLLLIPLWLLSGWIYTKFPLPQLHHLIEEPKS